MAESYKKMDAKAAAGMATSSEKTAQVELAWKEIRSDSEPLQWASFTVDGKGPYTLFASGSDGPEGLVRSLTEDNIFFCGLRSADKFFRVLYIGSEVGIIKRNKALMLKNAPFNAMPGATSDIDLPSGQPNDLLSLLL